MNNMIENPMVLPNNGGNFEREYIEEALEIEGICGICEEYVTNDHYYVAFDDGDLVHREGDCLDRWVKSQGGIFK